MSILNRPGTAIITDVGEGLNFQAQVTSNATAEVFDRRYNTVCTGQWLLEPTMSGKRALDAFRAKGMKVLVNYHRTSNADPSAIFVIDMKPGHIDALAEVTIRGAVSITIASSNDLECQKAFEFIRDLLPKWRPPRTEVEPKSHVNFWMMTPHGPAPMTRLLDVTTWKDVETNYPFRVRTQLAALVTHKADKSGQIIMLHGDPGVGKTWLLRALAWEWQPWCTMHYVMDCDQLLNGSPAYMTELLFSSAGPDPQNRVRAIGALGEELDAEDEDNKPPATIAGTPAFTTTPTLFGADRWRVIILEDSGELLTLDAANRTGQGLGRLLNSADGMLGQGSRVLFLITTNEPLDKIHPAISRPGRALANIHFDPFPVAEAKAWVKEKGGKDEEVTKEMTLAQMYSLVGGAPGTTQIATKDETKAFGFMGVKK